MLITVVAYMVKKCMKDCGVQVSAEPNLCADHSGGIHDERSHEGMGQALSAACLHQVWL